MEKKKKIKVICNSSPIIGLAKIERLDIIEKLYQEIIVPEAVFRIDENLYELINSSLVE
jgi:predicted nucleic acid-binding protein